MNVEVPVVTIPKVVDDPAANVGSHEGRVNVLFDAVHDHDWRMFVFDEEVTVTVEALDPVLVKATSYW